MLLYDTNEELKNMMPQTVQPIPTNHLGDTREYPARDSNVPDKYKTNEPSTGNQSLLKVSS